MTLTRRIAIAAVASLVASGCQLAFDLEDYPYAPILVLDDGGEDTADAGPEDTGPPDAAPDAPVDMPPDLPDPVGPQLLFSELLMDSSFTTENGEAAEFFEVVNIGDEPAVMGRVNIALTDPEDATFSDTWPVITQTRVELDPQGFFLIHRGDTPGGDFANDIVATRRFEVDASGLSNSEFRRADLIYDGEVHDSIFWKSGDLRLCASGGDILSCPEDDVVILPGSEGSSFFLRDDFTTREGTRSPEAWCKAAKVYVNGLNGYPGERNPSACP
jgi:hypothetical protein